MPYKINRMLILNVYGQTLIHKLHLFVYVAIMMWVIDLHLDQYLVFVMHLVMSIWHSGRMGHTI